MIVKDNLLRMQGFGAEPWEYQPGPTNYVETSSGNTADPVFYKPEPTNYVEKSSGNAYVASETTRPAEPERATNWTGIIDIIGGVMRGFNQPKQPTVVYQQPRSTVPTWLVPAAITGAAGVLVLAVLAKPRRSSAMGGYRRRRRSRR